MHGMDKTAQYVYRYVYIGENSGQNIKCRYGNISSFKNIYISFGVWLRLVDALMCQAFNKIVFEFVCFPHSMADLFMLDAYAEEEDETTTKKKELKRIG